MRSVFRSALAALALAFALTGCSGKGSVSGPFLGAGNHAYIVTSDFATGGLSVIDLDSREVTPNVATVHSDATLRVHDGLIYVINRFGQDNIQIIDPLKNFSTRRQYSTGNGSNPQDMVFLTSLKAYVSRYGSAEVLIVHPASGVQLGSISLAAFADSDGLPEMAWMAVVGPYVFVACQRLTNFAATNPSMVVVIDARTDAIVDVDSGTPGVQAITLAGRNPISDFAYDAASQELLIGCAGVFGALDGGVERIDAVTLQSLGFAITETALGGDVLDIAWSSSDYSFAVVSDASFNASVVAWSANAGTLSGSGPIYAPGGFSVPDIALNVRNELYVCDNTFTAPGVRVFSFAGAPLAGPLDTGLPPNQIAFR